MDYVGSNSLNNLQGLTKETYSKGISYNVPDSKPKRKFKKLIEALRGK